MAPLVVWAGRSEPLQRLRVREWRVRGSCRKALWSRRLAVTVLLSRLTAAELLQRLVVVVSLLMLRLLEPTGDVWRAVMRRRRRRQRCLTEAMSLLWRPAVAALLWPLVVAVLLLTLKLHEPIGDMWRQAVEKG